MAAINTSQTTSKEVVLQEKVTTSEYKIVEIHEHIRDRRVQVEIEFGPFTATGPGDQERGVSRRGVVVWNNDEYDAVRDTWTNADLIAKLGTLI